MRRLPLPEAIGLIHFILLRDALRLEIDGCMDPVRFSALIDSEVLSCHLF